MKINMPTPNFDEDGDQKFIEYLKTIKIKPNRKIQRHKFLTSQGNKNN
jgi:hypothetical protein